MKLDFNAISFFTAGEESISRVVSLIFILSGSIVRLVWCFITSATAILVATFVSRVSASLLRRSLKFLTVSDSSALPNTENLYLLLVEQELVWLDR
jgi:hypothetical protein